MQVYLTKSLIKFIILTASWILFFRRCDDIVGKEEMHSFKWSFRSVLSFGLIALIPFLRDIMILIGISGIFATDEFIKNIVNKAKDNEKKKIRG